LKNKRDLLIIGGLFLILLLFVIYGPGRTPPPQPSIPTSHSTSANGAQALYRWVRDLGYDARRLEYRQFELSEDDAALLILNPTEQITLNQIDEILDWVEQGGVLIFADDTLSFFGQSNQLVQELNFRTQVYSSTAQLEFVQAMQPVLDQPPVSQVQARTDVTLLADHDGYVELLGNDDALVMVGISRGRGYIYLSTTTYPFTNDGLRHDEHAALVLNLLRRIPIGGRIQFDEYHHGYFTPPSTRRVIFGSPWGWAASYAALAVGLYFVLSGRRFGKPVPLREEITLRSSAEFVENMADLFQRGGKRGYMAQHYYTTFKRALAKPLGINPHLPDDAFVREISRFRAINEEELLSLLQRLRSTPKTEAELLATVNSAHSYVDRHLGKR
jgi:hypothetical protein